MTKQIKQMLLNSLYAGYLGCSLGAFTNLTMANWEFWAISIPTIILATLIKNPPYDSN